MHGGTISLLLLLQWNVRSFSTPYSVVNSQFLAYKRQLGRVGQDGETGLINDIPITSLLYPIFPLSVNNLKMTIPYGKHNTTRNFDSFLLFKLVILLLQSNIFFF